MNPLTGFRRYRQTNHGLILQVEFCYWCADSFRWRCDWRDADCYDVLGIELCEV
jgi:hypothetical protein